MDHLERYYRFQSKIYDATRWIFLFGREEILRKIVTRRPGASEIVEIGCGTGHNLVRLAGLFPGARITGIDLSPEMLGVAHRRTARFGERISLLRHTQNGPLTTTADVILFSYSLSMMNPGWHDVLVSSVESLGPGGIVAAVDFHDTPVPPFKEHMANHHVRMGGHLLTALSTMLVPEFSGVQKAYGGLWSYFSFVGGKSNPSPPLKELA